MTLILKRVQLLKDKPRREAIDRFLRQHQLSLEADCEMAIIAEYQQRQVGCGAIAGNVLKCIAIDPSLQGEGLSLKLLTELLTLAYELGRSELFLFTKPCNAALFSGAGFWPIAFKVTIQTNADHFIRGQETIINALFEGVFINRLAKISGARCFFCFNGCGSTADMGS